MNTSTEHIPLCNQSEPLDHASGRIVDLMNENVTHRMHASSVSRLKRHATKSDDSNA